MANALFTCMADAQKYRDEAKRLRQEAEHIPDINTKRQVLQIAKMYDRLADNIEKRPKIP